MPTWKDYEELATRIQKSLAPQAKVGELLGYSAACGLSGGIRGS